MTVFEIFCPKSIWDKSQFKLPKSKKSEKIKAQMLYQHFKVSLFFQFVYLLVPKIEIGLEYFLDEIF